MLATWLDCLIGFELSKPYRAMLLFGKVWLVPKPVSHGDGSTSNISTQVIFEFYRRMVMKSEWLFGFDLNELKQIQGDSLGAYSLASLKLNHCIMMIKYTLLYQKSTTYSSHYSWSNLKSTQTREYLQSCDVPWYFRSWTACKSAAAASDAFSYTLYCS